MLRNAAILITLIFWSLRADSQSREDSIIYWLTNNTHELTSAHLDAPQDDLLFLKSILADKKIVSMGEATHGTSEFASMKGRFFKFLVQHLDFRAIALEVDFVKALMVNDYVLGRRDDAEYVVKSLGYFHCANVETLDLVRWMRHYNDQVRHHQKIKFYGFDAYSPKDALERLLEYFTRLDTVLAARIRDIEIIEKEDRFQYTIPYVALDDIEGLEDQIDADSARYIQSTSYKEWKLTRHLATLLRYSFQITNSPRYEARGQRDSLMKRNVDWIMDFEGPAAKMVLWAHNAHVMQATFGTRSDKRLKWMGLWLKEQYGDALYTIGFDFNKGGFHANAFEVVFEDGKRMINLKPGQFELDETPRDRLTWWFSQTGKALLFINFKDADGNELMEPWLKQRHKIRHVDAIFLEDWKNDPEGCCYYPITPSVTFDGMIYVENTHAITKL